MTWTAAPPGYPSSSNYLAGTVRNSTGIRVGELTMGWISKYLRKATLEIDRVAASEAPIDNGAGIDYRDVYNAIGWDVTIDVSDSNVTEASGESWSDAEMHAAMLARRDSALDREWRYHLICVRRLDSTTRGIMYDAYGGDSNNIRARAPGSRRTGRSRTRRLGNRARDALRHCSRRTSAPRSTRSGTRWGCTTTRSTTASCIRRRTSRRTPCRPQQFPDNILWSFSPDDRKRLRHLPDIWVRPGGIAFGTDYSTSPISPTDSVEDAEGLTLTVKPLMAAIPIGAPVRVEFAIRT